MLEQSLRELFERQTEVEPPPGRVTVADVIRQGRLRRRRLFAAVGTPAFAAVAAVAIAVSTSALPLGARPQPATQASGATARHFSALSPYATFGWLPAKEPVVPGHQRALAQLNSGGWIDEVSESLNSGPWMLEVYAIGACHQVGNQIHCGNNNPGWTAADERADRVGRFVTPNFCGFAREVPATPVNGHQAFWVNSDSHCLNWEYAPGGWATLFHYNEIRPSNQLVLRIASAIRFGGHQPSFKFATPLRGLPGNWRVIRADFGVTHGTLWSGGYTVTNGAADIDISVTHANAKHNKCERFHTKPRRGGPVHLCRVINGYYVNYLKPTKPTTPSCPPGKICATPDNFAQIWASDAENWNVSLETSPRYFGLLFKVFAHMTVLGANATAAWTTKPII